MKLVIDCFKLVKGTGKSIGIYNLTKNLVENLAESNNKESDTKGSSGKGNSNKKDSIIVLGTKHNREDFDIPGVKFVSVKYNPYNKLVCIIWELYLVTIALKKIRADRVLFPRGFAPLFHATEEYVIIHDMIPFYYHKNFPGILNPLENLYIMWRLKASAKKCDGVLTDSIASKQEILRLTKINEHKVHVVYPGQNKISLEPKEEKEKTTEPEQTSEYICAITSQLPHKNAKGVIESYTEYYKKTENPMPLVIIGLENINEYSVPDEVRSNITCYKYLKEDADMYKIIRQSRLFLFLSYIEGFGFPPLEAMQLGVPVICSNVSSIPEVVGDAAVLVDPYDSEQIAEKLSEMTSNRELCEKYVLKGYDNAERFLWKNRIVEYKKILLNCS